MVVPVLCFAAGALVCHRFEELPDAPVLLALAALAFLLATLKGAAARVAVSLSAFLVGLVWTAAVAQLELDRRLPRTLIGNDLDVTGHVVGVPAFYRDRIRLDLEVVRGGPPLWRSSGCRLRLTWYRPPAGMRVSPGELWAVRVRLKPPRARRNIGGFDGEHRALRDGVCAAGYLRAPPRLLAPPGLAAAVDRLRAHLAQRIDEHAGDLPTVGLLKALALGLRHDIRAPQRWILQSTGTAHLVAISGLHVGLVAGAGFAILGAVLRLWTAPLLLMPRACWCGLGALMSAFAYAALAGFSVPTLRALLMLAAYVAATCLRRRGHRLQPLVLALGVLVLVQPLAARDPSTWLSFTAVAGLLWALQANAGGPAGLPGTLVRLLRLQLVATLVMFPIGVFLFGYQPLVAPLANFLAVPLTGLVAVPAILLGLLLDGVCADAAGWCLRAAAHVLGLQLEILERLPWRERLFTPPVPPSGMMLMLAAAGAAVVLSPLPRRLRLLGALWMAPLLIPAAVSLAPGSMELRVFDVGQGLSVALRTAGHTLVFDAGPGWQDGRGVGDTVVAPALRRDGVAAVDVLMISHHHSDHAGGAEGLLRVMPVTRAMGDGSRLARPSTPCRRGQRWRWDEVRFEVLHPPPGTAPGNDASCVLRVSGPGGAVLLPADIEERAESELTRHAAGGLASEVLLVPHHGSRTSSSAVLLDAVRPRIAINTSGYRNRYRFPAASVVQRYRARGIRFLDTACHGEVRVRLARGVEPRVSTWWDTSLRFWHVRDRPAHCGR